MSSRKIDLWLLVVGVVLIGISSYQLFFLRQVSTENLASLGILTQKESVVKIKSTFALDWRDAFSGSTLTEKQLIYTDENSSAEIQLLQGHKVSISENSLIRISSLSKGTGLDLERGFIRAKLDGKEPLILEVNGSELKLSGDQADVQINLNGDVGEIGVLNGSVSVERQGEVEKIDTKTALKISESGMEVEKIPFTLTTPAMNQVFYYVDEPQEISFQWNPSDSGSVLISSTSDFKASQKLEGFTSSLSAGSYFWKVQNAEGASLIGHFKVVQELPPRILRPVNGEVVRIPAERNKAELFVQWLGEIQNSYMIEWKTTEVNSTTVTGTSGVIPLEQSGSLDWRVKAADADRPLAQWSEWQHLEIKIIQAPAIPTRLFPDEFEVQRYTPDEEEVELTWQSELPVELEILNPNEISKIHSVMDNKYKLALHEKGTYQWRVRTVDELNRRSSWSDWKKIELVDLTEEVKQEGIQRIQLKRPDQAVTFNWQSDATSVTEFELASDKKFLDVIVKKNLSGDQVKIVVPKTGVFYWRSRQYKGNGSFHVSEPKRVIIEPAPAPHKPEKLPDVEVPLKWEETSFKSKGSWWDFLLSSAYADEVKGIVSLKLPKHEDAKSYTIRIYRDSEAKELLLEEKIQDENFIWRQANPGQYYWQYAINDYWDRQSPFSDLASLKVIGERPDFPERSKLLQPIRATEVESSQLDFKWTDVPAATYRLEISRDPEFSKNEFSSTLSNPGVKLTELELKEGLYYWRITTINSHKLETKSSTGRFTIVPPLERITIVDKAPEWKKIFSRRISGAWSPSSDTYEFKGDGQKGKIDGHALNGFEIKGTHFGERWILNGEFFRQSGKVFKSENYLFQRILVDATWKKNLGSHLYSFGVAAGQVSGMSYSIKNDEAFGSSVSSLAYGPMIRGHFVLSPKWEIQSKLTYLLGDIAQTEVGGEGLMNLGSYQFLMGLNYAMRSYDASEGSQNSLRISLGLAKDF